MIATDAASFERLGTVGACITKRKLFINIDHHESNTRYADINWVSAREALDRRIDLPLAESGQMADHQADCRLSVHRRFDRHRLLPISDHPARALTTSPANWSTAARIWRKICDEVYQSYPFPACACCGTSTANSV